MESSPEWSIRTKRTITLIAFFGVLLLLYMLRSILPLVILAALLAFIFNPLVNFLTKRVLISRSGMGPRRGLAALITFVMAIVFITFAALIVIPAVADQVQDFGRSIPRLLQRFENDLQNILAMPLTAPNGEPLLIDGQPFVPLDRIEEATGLRDLSQILLLDQLNINAATQAVFSSAGLLTGPAFSFLGGAFNTLITLTFLLMMTFYLMKDGVVFIASVLSLVPEPYQDDAHRIMQDLADVWNAYIRGQLILALVIGTAVYIAALSLGLPNAPILGIIAGMLEFIPNLGPLLALIPAAFVALVSDSATIPFLGGFPFMIVVIITWTAIQQLEAVFLVPRILGDSLDLHPFIVLVAVLGGAAIGGAIGVILAAPFVASSRVVLRYFYGKVTDTDPFLVRNPRRRIRQSFLAILLKRFMNGVSIALMKLVRRLRNNQTRDPS